MLKVNHWKYVLVLLLIGIGLSCKKKKNSPFKNGEVCPLLSIVNEQGQKVRDFEYVNGRLIRIYLTEDIESTLEFYYDGDNVLEYMAVKTPEEVEQFTAHFIYDTKGKISGTTSTLGDYEFMQNEFVYDDNDVIVGVNSKIDLYGQQVELISRVEYNGKNVSRVFTSVNGQPEKLAFNGDFYDDKPQFFPKAYKNVALGFMGIDNSYFMYFGENNLTNGRFYDELGKVNQSTSIIYDYNKNGLPASSDISVLNETQTQVKKYSYEFDCN